MQFYTTELIEIITGFQFLFLALFLLVNKKQEKTARLFLLLFLLGKGITLFSRYTYKFVDQLTGSETILYFWGLPFLLFYSPFLYFYVKTLTGEQKSLNKYILPHLLPFLLLAVIISFKYLFNPEGTLITLTKFGWIFSPGENHAVSAVYYAQALTYTIAAIVQVSRFRNRLKDNYSAHEQINLNNSGVILSGFLTVFSIFLLEYLIYSFTDIRGNWIYSVHLGGVIALFLFANILALKGLGIPAATNEILADEKKEYPESLDVKSEFIKLKNVLLKDELHLNPNLSLAELSQVSGIAARNISAVIKQNNFDNFYDFINFHRIEEAKQILVAHPEKTILDVAYTAGFNSKSVFNSAFRKFTGTTPSAYRKNYKNINEIAA